MIDPILKKFGMSQARKSVKNIRNTQYSKTPQRERTPNTSDKKLTITNSLQQTSRLKTTERKPPTTLQRLIQYLKSNYNKPCPYHSHTMNKIKFICLNEPCSQNLGCAECFLYKHGSHVKAEVGTCMRQLQELNCFMRDSYETMISQKAVIKDHFIKQIDLQINHMCDEFHRNLQFLKNKALKQINDHLFAKYEELQILNAIKSQQIDGVTDQTLIGELMKIDIKGIEKSLGVQMRELSFQKLNLQPLIKFFEEMNGAHGIFMAQFKKCFPKIYSFQHNQTLNNSGYLTKEFNSRLNTVSQFRSDQQQNKGERAQ